MPEIKKEKPAPGRRQNSKPLALKLALVGFFVILTVLGGLALSGVRPADVWAAIASISRSRVDLNNGLVGHWTFDGSKLSATTAFDSSGKGKHGTIVGSLRPEIGSVGQGLYFNGSDGAVSIPLNLLSGKYQGTISVFFKSSDANGAIVSGYRNCSWYAYKLVLSSGKLAGGFGTSLGNPPVCSGLGVNSFDVVSDANYNDNKWHHAVITYDGSSLATTTSPIILYIDGVEIKRAYVKTGFMLQQSALASLGVQAWGFASNQIQGVGYLEGSIDDVRIYNRAISPNEVKALYQMGAVNSNTIGTTPSGNRYNDGLVGHWTFDGKNRPPPLLWIHPDLAIMGRL